MRWRASAMVPGALLLLWLAGNMALGPSGGGVELNTNRTGVIEPNPFCERIHTYAARGWGGHELLRSDVWLTGCKNSSGQMRIESSPTCTATSFLGAGSTSCNAIPDGNDLKVIVNVSYPLWVAWISSIPATTTFRIDPGGGYNLP